MKKFSKFVYAILFALISILSFQGLIFSAPENKKSHAIDMNVNGIFDYISVSQENQTINASNIRVSADGLTAYVIAKNSISIKFEPLRYNYSFSIDRLPAADLETYFYIDWSEEISIRPEGGTITYNGRNYDYNITSTNYFQVVEYTTIEGSQSIFTSIIVSSQHSSLLKYNSDAHTLQIAENISLKNEQDLDLTISIISSNYGTAYSSDYHLVFLEPVQNFDIDKFISYKLFSDESTGEVVPDIKNDETFHKLQFSIQNNDYTEQNPLYININFNGFIYNFTMFSREVEEERYVCVEYYDTQYPSSLATHFKLKGNRYTLDTDYPVYPVTHNGELNPFVFEFTQTGRYDLEIYDSTHTYGLTNQNYYTSSFFILNKNNSDYDNIYAIAQRLGNDNNPIEYINIKSEKLNINGQNIENDIIALNNGVLVTLKNLTGGEESDLEDAIQNITISRTIFGSSTSIPETKTYSVNEIKYALETKTPLQTDESQYYEASINDNGEICLNFKSDAYYVIDINPAHKDQEPVTTSYKFQIIKQAKSSFTYFENGVSHDEVAQTPFHTEIITPSTNIKSSLLLNTYAYTDDAVEEQEKATSTLIKTYVNTYELRFGMEQVEMNATTAGSTLTITFMGVGDMDISVTFNGDTTHYTLNSELGNNILTFSEIGTYTVTMVDSMGTTATNSYTVKQALNTSAIVLIALSAVILVFIIIFILRARGKVKTK